MKRLKLESRLVIDLSVLLIIVNNVTKKGVLVEDEAPMIKTPVF